MFDSLLIFLRDHYLEMPIFKGIFQVILKTAVVPKPNFILIFHTPVKKSLYPETVSIFGLWDPWKYQQNFSVNKCFTLIFSFMCMGDRELDKATKEINFPCFCHLCLGSLTYEQSRDSHSNLSGYLLLRSTKHMPRKRTFAPHK